MILAPDAAARGGATPFCSGTALPPRTPHGEEEQQPGCSACRIPAAGNYIPHFHCPSCKARLEALPHVLIPILQPRPPVPPPVSHFHQAHSGTSVAIPATKGHRRGVGIKTLVKRPFGKPGLHLIRCRRPGLPEQQVNQLMAAMSWALLCRPGGSPCRAARSSHSFPSPIWENSCSDKGTASWGMGRPQSISCSPGAARSPCTRRKAGGWRGADAGFNGLPTDGGRRGVSDGPGLKREVQPQSPGRFHRPTEPRDRHGLHAAATKSSSILGWKRGEERGREDSGRPGARTAPATCVRAEGAMPHARERSPALPGTGAAAEQP